MLVSISNREDFISKFLTPVSKISESACITISSDSISCLATNADNSLILHVKFPQENPNVSTNVSLNVPNINRFISLFACITTDDFSMEYDQNRIVCTSGDLQFKYHLLEDGILKIPSINIKKIKDLEFDTNFFLTKDSVSQLLRASTFTTDTDKLYVSTSGAKVIGELTDKQQANVDCFSQPIAMSFSGLDMPEPISINFELIRVIGSLRLNRDCKTVVRVNKSNSVFLFDIQCDGNKLKYITSAFAE